MSDRQVAADQLCHAANSQRQVTDYRPLITDY
jgi:hypothetical protein